MEWVLCFWVVFCVFCLCCCIWCVVDFLWELDFELFFSLVQVLGVVVLCDLSFFGGFLCCVVCLCGCFGLLVVYLFSEEMELEFCKWSFYNYLQVVYFKINKLEKVVVVVYIFFVGNFEYMEMWQNLDYY